MTRRRPWQGWCQASRRKGTRIFEDRHDLKPVEATSFENGVVLLRYEIEGYRRVSALPLLAMLGVGGLRVLLSSTRIG